MNIKMVSVSIFYIFNVLLLWSFVEAAAFLHQVPDLTAGLKIKVKIKIY